MLLQTDGRWSHLQLGVIDEKVITIGDAGCLLVSLCNANCLVGNLLLPDTLLQELANVEGVTKEGNLLWVKLRYTSSVIWEYREMGSRLEGMYIVEYQRPHGGSHFVLSFNGHLLDPKPGIRCLEELSVRRLGLIPILGDS